MTHRLSQLGSYVKVNDLRHMWPGIYAIRARHMPVLYYSSTATA